jgi:hypothetical protein
VGASIGPRVGRPYRHPARAKEGRGMARRTLHAPLTVAAAVSVAGLVALLVAVSGEMGLSKRGGRRYADGRSK